MCMHHELSYALEVPGLMLFACLDPPTHRWGGRDGGRARTGLEALPPGAAGSGSSDNGWLLRPGLHRRDRSIVRRGVRHRLTAEAVERYCRANMIETAWQADGGLRTRQRRPAVVRHPVTGRRCWFNQVAFLNRWTLEPTRP